MFSQQIANIITATGIDVAIFPKAEPNPTDQNVEDGVAVYHAENCDSIVSLGGGSAHDAKKKLSDLLLRMVDAFMIMKVLINLKIHLYRILRSIQLLVLQVK